MHTHTRASAPRRQSDVIAGLSVGFMVVPQSMSYANLAGLPSVYGLYGSFLPVLAYALVRCVRCVRCVIRRNC